MKKIDISKGLMISVLIYSVTLLFEAFMQFSGVLSLQINSFAITSYLLVLVIRPISLIAIIIFCTVTILEEIKKINVK